MDFELSSPTITADKETIENVKKLCTESKVVSTTTVYETNSSELQHTKQTRRALVKAFQQWIEHFYEPSHEWITIDKALSIQSLLSQYHSNKDAPQINKTELIDAIHWLWKDVRFLGAKYGPKTHVTLQVYISILDII